MRACFELRQANGRVKKCAGVLCVLLRRCVTTNRRGTSRGREKREKRKEDGSGGREEDEVETAGTKHGPKRCGLLVMGARFPVN